MSGAIKLDQYIKAAALKVNNTQKLLSYYRELYQLYTDAGMPDNKFIYFLEENLYTEPLSTIPPEVYDFMSLKQDEINLLTGYVRMFKKLTLSDGQVKLLEFPFENKTDFRAFADPARYLNNDYPFATTRFMGPVAELKDISVSFVGAGAKGATVYDKNAVNVSFGLLLQDAKVLFKNWTDVDNELQYKDLFASPFGSNRYEILFEIGYNVPPENPVSDFSKIKRVASRKALISLTPVASEASFDYREDGSLEIKSTLHGTFSDIQRVVNILDNKYYSKLKTKNNMPTLDETFTTSITDFYQLEESAPALKKEAQRNAKQSPGKVNEPKKNIDITKNKEQIERERRLLQLANNVKTIPSVFPFIAALYEAGLIYYFEIDNDIYKDYITKIADGEPVDISEINFLPKKKKKLRLSPGDLLKRNNKSDVNASTLNIKKLNDLRLDSSNTATEKVKFFYFGDLVEIMLNNQEGTGVGQDLDFFGKDDFKFLFGQIMWIKNNSKKVLYNILSTPISLDMFLHELNIEIFTKNKREMSLRFFFSVFMKRFFDNIINSTEKTKTGKEQQRYSGDSIFSFDKFQFLINKESDSNKAKFKKKLFNLTPSFETSDVVSVNLVTAIPMNTSLTTATAKKRNVPTVYVGGVDRGPVGNVKVILATLPGYAEAQRIVTSFDVNSNSKNSIGESIDSSTIITSKAKIEFDLIGNNFLDLGDRIYLDTRFVDGGYFQQKENKIFLTGYYFITKVTHNFRNGRWLTSYAGYHQEDDSENNNAFTANAGLLPDDQRSSITSNANQNQSNVNNNPVTSTVDKPTVPGAPSSKAKLKPEQKGIDGDLPITVPNNNIMLS